MAKISKWLLGCVLGLAMAVPALAQESDERILWQEIPLVFASSKRLQPITETASSMEIITAEDIKQSGATNLGDVLRSVSGVDVREAHASQHVVGIRGFADTRHVLVTIDGNNVFMYHANHIFFNWMPVDLEEIDRVEIIKGPGAVFYGGNAFSGVVNIVTKNPRQLAGTSLTLVGGGFNTMRTNVIYGGNYKKLDYSITAGHREADEWEEPKIPQEREKYFISHFGLNGVYNIGPESSLTSSLRYSTAKGVISRVCNPDTTFFSIQYRKPGLQSRLFYNGHEKTFWSDTFGVVDANYEAEVIKTLEWGKNVTSFGGYAKRTSWEIKGLKGAVEGLTEKHSVKDYAINLENEHHLSDKLALTAGVRGEYYTYQNLLGLGRGSIIYKITDDQNLRYTIGSGYSLPSLFEQTNEGTVYPYALGNSRLKEEKVLSQELSYSGLLADKLKLNAAVFYNDYKDLIDDSQAGPQQNIADAYQYGGELGAKYIFSAGLTGFVNYSYQRIHRDDFGDMDVDPRNKVNLGMNMKSGRWSTNLDAHYVDRYREIYLTANPVFGRVEYGPVEVNSYTTLNARIAYSPADNLELAVAGYNLNNDRHYESNNIGWHTADLIGRRITASASYKF